METARAKRIIAIVFFAPDTHRCSKRTLLLLLFFLNLEHCRGRARGIAEQRDSVWGCGAIPDGLLLRRDDPGEDRKGAVGFSGDPDWDYLLYALCPQGNPRSGGWFTPVEQTVLTAVPMSWRDDYPAKLEDNAKGQGGPWH